MPDPERSVDAAMAAERPAKEAVRNMWVEEVQRQKAFTPQGIPFYLTLAGAKGLDLQALINAGVIETTETGAIAEGDNHRVIALEKDMLSVLELQKNFIGLKVESRDIFQQLQGTSPIAFPGGEARVQCRASVINLDLNGALLVRNNEFPILEAIVKLGSLHKAPPIVVPWTLFLTVNADINWTQEIGDNAQALLMEQCRSNPALAAGCEELLGHEMYGGMLAGSYVSLADLPREGEQAFLMSFVPVWLALKIDPQGWRLEVVANIKYGGEEGVAPIVTWIIRFLQDERAGGNPQAVMTDSMTSVVTACYEIDADGTVRKIVG